MKSRAVLVILIFLLVAPVSGGAQRRRKSSASRARPQPTAPKVDPTIEADRRAAATRVAEQIKTLSHFLYILGGVVKSVAAVERAAHDAGAPDAAKAADKNKATIRDSIRNVQIGLVQLETEFDTKPALRPYARLVIGSSDGAALAGQQADAGQYDQAGDTLLRVVYRLADALAAMRQPPAL